MTNNTQIDFGIDLTDMAEFPMGLLTDKPIPGDNLIREFRNGDKELKIEGDIRYGLPTPLDLEVYVLLIQLSREQGHPDAVKFTRYQMLKELGWGDRVARYDRLLLSFRRWARTRFMSSRTFWDNDEQTEIIDEQDFSILANYRVVRKNVEEQLRATESDFACKTKYPSARWGDLIVGLLRQGYHHDLDARRYLDLKSAIAQAEYRYLAGRCRDGKPVYRQHLKTFAQQHLGVRQEKEYDIRRLLEPAHQELIAAGICTQISYETIQGIKNRGESMVVFHLPQKKKPLSPRSPAVRAIPAQTNAAPRARATEAAKPSRATSAQPQSTPAEADPFAPFDAWWKEQPEEWREEQLAAAEAKYLEQATGPDTLRELFRRTPGIRYQMVRPFLLPLLMQVSIPTR